MLLPPVADGIRNVVRKAYYLGVGDGIELGRENERESKRDSA